MKIHCLRLLLPAIAACIFASCAPKHKPYADVPELAVARVQTFDVPVSTTFVGQLYGCSDIPLIARSPGYLKKIYFKEGAFVRAGQLLYLVEPHPVSAKVTQARAALDAARAQLVTAEENYKRVKPLAEANAMSQSDLDNAISQLASARSQARSAEAALQIAEIDLSYTRVVSPVDGIIGRSNAKVGDFVGTGSGLSTLNTVSQVDSMLVRFFISTNLYLNLKQNSDYATFRDIQLVLSNDSVYPVGGRFNFMGRDIDPSTGSIETQVSFLNPDTLLRPGQFARVRATVGIIPDAYLVPQRAMIQIQGEYFLFVVGQGDTVHQRKVTAGPLYKSMWVVLSGVEKDETVVTEGFHKLYEGARIKPVYLSPADSAKVAPAMSVNVHAQDTASAGAAVTTENTNHSPKDIPVQNDAATDHASEGSSVTHNI